MVLVTIFLKWEFVEIGEIVTHHVNNMKLSPCTNSHWLPTPWKTLFKVASINLKQSTQKIVSESGGPSTSLALLLTWIEVVMTHQPTMILASLSHLI